MTQNLFFQWCGVNGPTKHRKLYPIRIINDEAPDGHVYISSYLEKVYYLTCKRGPGKKSGPVRTRLECHNGDPNGGCSLVEKVGCAWGGRLPTPGFCSGMGGAIQPAQPASQPAQPRVAIPPWPKKDQRGDHTTPGEGIGVRGGGRNGDA